jgi:hypothetical protein
MVIGILTKWQEDTRLAYAKAAKGLQEVAQMMVEYKAMVLAERQQARLLAIDVDYERL